jgi:Tol biopolymer transport system component
MACFVRRFILVGVLFLGLLVSTSGCSHGNRNPAITTGQSIVYIKAPRRYAPYLPAHSVVIETYGEKRRTKQISDDAKIASRIIISPDGNRLAYLREETGRASFLCLSPARGALDVCDAVDEPISPIAWSPDGSYLLGTSGATKLLLVDTRQLTYRLIVKGEMSGASYAPDGKAIVYSVKDEPRTYKRLELGYNLFINTISSGHTVRLTSGGTSIAPVWGKRGIAFSRITRRRNSLWPRYELWLIKPDNGRVRRIDYGVEERLPCIGLTPVAWSSDGIKLLANMNEAENNEPYAVDMRERRVWRISKGAFIEVTDISRSGKYALVVRNGLDWTAPPRVEIIRINTSSSTILAKGAFGPSWNR